MKLSPEEIQARLEELRRSYLASLEEKRDAIVTQWAALCRQWDAETYQSLYIIIHSLAGSAETFGLPDITRDARKVVDLFKRHADKKPLDHKSAQLINTHIHQLVTTMQANRSEK